MARSVITVILIIFCNIISGQDQVNKITYNTYLNNELILSAARDYYREQDFASAVKIIEDKYKCIGNGCRFKNHYLARYYSYIDTLKSIDHLKLAVSQGQRLMYIIHDFGIEDSTALKIIEDNYLSSLNFEAIELLHIAAGRDQTIRKKWKELHKTKEYREELTKIDSLNQLLLDSIVYYHGWPGISLIGTFANLKDYRLFPDPQIILLHSDENYMFKYLKVIKSACEIDDESWLVFKNVLKRMLEYRNYNDTLICDFIHFQEDAINLENIQPELECLAEHLNEKNDHRSTNHYEINLVFKSVIGSVMAEKIKLFFENNLNFQKQIEISIINLKEEKECTLFKVKALK